MRTETKRKPTGYIATCQCGVLVGAIDLINSERKDAGKVLGNWVANGCLLTPKFDSMWSAYVKPCQCETK